MWSAPRRRERSGRAGFTLIEVMVALIVAVVLGAGLVRFFAGVRHDAFRLREDLDAWVVARAVLDSVPSGAAVSPGTTVGATGAFSWRLEAVPMGQLSMPVAPVEGEGEGEAPDAPQPLAMRLSVDVTGPRSGTARLETIRLVQAGQADDF
jgi:prepilin-type N-terminal cleavage/methylation domain-containing protein